MLFPHRYAVRPVGTLSNHGGGRKHIPPCPEKVPMTDNHRLLYPLALFKQRYTRGTSWTQIVLNFGIITANAKLFEDFFLIHLGLTLPMVIALSVPCYIIVCYVIGHFDEKSGFWQIENNLNYRVTPYSEEMLTSIREIKKQLDSAEGHQT
jgi:hypothetical protein